MQNSKIVDPKNFILLERHYVCINDMYDRALVWEQMEELQVSFLSL